MALGTDTLNVWLVLLEAADERGRSSIDPSGFDRLIGSWAAPAPTTLYSPSRYALQISVEAVDPPSALAWAIGRWKHAVDKAGLPDWDLVRAEIMTPAELEHELLAADIAYGGDGTRPGEPEPASDAVGHELLRRTLDDSLDGLAGSEVLADQARGPFVANGSSPSGGGAMPNGRPAPSSPPSSTR